MNVSVTPKQRRSQRQRLREYSFLKPLFRTRPKQKSRTILPYHQRLATLADLAYRRNGTIINKALKITDLSEEYIYRSDFSTSEMRVFESPSTKTIVAAFKASKMIDRNQIDQTLTGDIAVDFAAIIDLEKKFKWFKRSLKQWTIMRQQTPLHKHILIGHSLGGAIARYIYNVHAADITEVHTFNPQMGLAQMVHRLPLEAKYHAHYILGDPLDVLGIHTTDNTHVYIPQDEVAHANLLKTFLNKD